MQSSGFRWPIQKEGEFCMEENIQVTGFRAKRHSHNEEEPFHMPNPVSEAEVEKILAERERKTKEGLKT